MAEEPFLHRWSRRKVEARVAPVPDVPEPQASPAPTSPAAALAEGAEPAQPAPLPPIESINVDSDFTGFMKPDVEEGLRNKALKTLFQDPHFNVMDGLDIYIADYSQPDPMPESWLSQLNQVARLGAWKDPDEKAEKPLEEQGLASASREASSDTVDGGISPPPVTQSDPSAPV